MRLLEQRGDGEFSLTKDLTENLPPYAILSHTWGADTEEVTFSDIMDGTGKDKAGYDKIRFCGEQAKRDDLQYFWVDTCCINKLTSDELNTAINSMFRWYQNATKCYVYLSDVSIPDEIVDAWSYRITWEAAFQRSRWFTRGWTLQELLAPATVVFFSCERKRLGDKIQLEEQIHERTGIAIEVLRGKPLTEVNVEERMAWVAKRETTIKEDKAYCLLGIFGVFMPLIYGEGHGHASIRLREEIERSLKRNHQLRSEALQGSSAVSLIPFLRNEWFVGREDKLKDLDEKLFSSYNHQRVAICGLGGCGKTAIALEFAYRTIEKYPHRAVLWVPAISLVSFEKAYRDIGTLLRIPGITDDNSDVKRLVEERLTKESSGDWLLIVDNADNTGLLLDQLESGAMSRRLVDYLPRSRRGRIIFTTRSRKAAVALAESRVIELHDMSGAEGKQMIAQRLIRKELVKDSGAIDKLLDVLAHLPLAIVQAVAFINTNGISVSDYISIYRSSTSDLNLFGEHYEDSSRYPGMENTVARTWHISFDRIRKHDALAADYLSFIACIARDNIPMSLLPIGGSTVERVKAIGTLEGYAFITERQHHFKQAKEEKFYDTHRLVHMASIGWLRNHEEWGHWVNKVSVRLRELVPFGGHEGRETWINYLPHAIHVGHLSDVLSERVRASLLDRVGRCQEVLGQFSAAETTHRQVLSLREKTLGKEHGQTLTSMNEVGVALHKQGKYKEAEKMHRETLALCEKVLGKEHPSTLSSINEVGLALSRRGKYKEAEKMHRETLALREKVLGKEHPSTLASINNLGLVLRRQGKYEEAEKMHRETLALRKKVLGKEQPHTLMNMDNLGLVLRRQGKYEEAGNIHRETLALKEKVLGKNHPSTLISMNNFGLALCDQGKYEEAEKIHQETLALREKVLGREHPYTQLSLKNLAATLRAQGKHVEADILTGRSKKGYPSR